MATQAQRQHIAALTHELARYSPQLAYPISDERTSLDAMCWHMTETALFTYLEAGHVAQFDCSELYAWVLRAAGCWHWSTPGYTGTDLQVLQPHYTNAKDAEIGAGVIFGPGTGHHVAWVITPNPKSGNPGLAGHGRPGFTLNTLAEESAVQAALGYPGVTFCSIAHV